MFTPTKSMFDGSMFTSTHYIIGVCVALCLLTCVCAGIYITRGMTNNEHNDNNDHIDNMGMEEDKSTMQQSRLWVYGSALLACIILLGVCIGLYYFMTRRSNSIRRYSIGSSDTDWRSMIIKYRKDSGIPNLQSSGNSPIPNNSTPQTMSIDGGRNVVKRLGLKFDQAPWDNAAYMMKPLV